VIQGDVNLHRGDLAWKVHDHGGRHLGAEPGNRSVGDEEIREIGEGLRLHIGAGNTDQSD